MDLNTINISSNNHQNDYFSLSVAMDAATNSEINLFSINGFVMLQYTTKSDYVFEFSRHRDFTDEVVTLESSSSGMIGYPDKISWIPGGHVSMLSQEQVVSNKIPPTQDISLLDDNQYHKGEFLILGDYYNLPSPQVGQWEPQDLRSIEGSNKSVPHLEVRTKKDGSYGRVYYAVKYFMDHFSFPDEFAEGIPSFDQLLPATHELMAIEIFSSKLEGSLFQFNIKRNFLEKDLLGQGAFGLQKKPNLIYDRLVDKNTTLTEWNSIFDINGSANADSIFRDGSNRDEVFYQQLEEYINKNWYGKLRRNLWGDAIEDESVELTTRDPKILKDNILYCFYYFGASDDVKNLGLFSYKDYSPGSGDTVIRWHIGLGAKSRYSNERRSLLSEQAYLPPVKQQKKISKVVGLSPRPSYAYDVEYNKIEGSNRNKGFIYNITFVDTPGGREALYPDPLYRAGQEVIILTYPEDNFFLGSISAVDEEGNSVDIVDNKIIMPASNVTVTATYVDTSQAFNISFIAPEEEILATQPDAAEGEVVIAYAIDTSNLYIYYQGKWYIYNNSGQGAFNISFQATESEIFATQPDVAEGEVVIAYGIDTSKLYIYYEGSWYVYDNSGRGTFNISFQGTEEEIFATQPDAAEGEVVIAYAIDTLNLYIYHEGSWYIYRNSSHGPFNINFQATEAEILATQPNNPSGEATVAYATDTKGFYIYYDGIWYILNND